jgi:hypothetical protein
MEHFNGIDKFKSIVFKIFDRLFGKNPPLENDPYAGSPVRNRRGPNNRSAAVAVAEPDED